MANFHYRPADDMSERFKMGVHKLGGINAAIKWAKKNECASVGDTIISFHRLHKAGEMLDRLTCLRDGVVAVARERSPTDPYFDPETLSTVWRVVLPTWEIEKYASWPVEDEDDWFEV